MHTHSLGSKARVTMSTIESINALSWARNDGDNTESASYLHHIWWQVCVCMKLYQTR